MSTLLLLVGRVMVGLLRAEGRATATLLTGRTLDRLGSRLRADVRGAVDVEVQPQSLVLNPGDEQRITYAVVGDRLERTVRRGDDVEAFDRYTLRDHALRFESDANGLVRFNVRQGESTRFLWRVDVRRPPTTEGER